MSKRTIHDLITSIGIPKLKTTPHGYAGCCVINPHHDDSKPSMHIHLEKGHVKCFSCDAYKPLFQFLLDNGATFEEAVEYMFIDYTREKIEVQGLQEYFIPRQIPKSMIDRGFTIETLQHFEVGYDTLKNHITIPLRFNGILYGLQFRKPPKDFSSTDGFNKDLFIYNYKPTDIRVYVEGFTDTWKVWQNGTKNVSSTLSANPSDGQLEIMSKHKEIWIGYDNDVAGYRGAFKVHKELGRDVDIFMIPYRGKDPDGCTPEQWQQAIKNRTSFTEFEVALITKNPELYDTIIKSKL